MDVAGIRYSLVIPCYNESEGLPDLVNRCDELLEQLDESEVLLVNNGSTDNSGSVFRSLGLPSERIRVVDVSENKGYGHGILSGLQEAKGEVIGWTHADLQTDPMDFKLAVDLINEEGLSGGNFIVKGRRVGRPLGDLIFTAGMSLFETILLRTPMRDINAQPTVFDRDSMLSWVDQAPADFSLDLFVYFQARQLRAAVRRFPVFFTDRRHGHSRWNFSWKSKMMFIRRTVAFSFSLARSLSRI